MANFHLVAACAAVRRRRSNKTYSPADYEVCLEGAGDLLGLPSWSLDNKSAPTAAVLNRVRTELKLTATQAFPLRVYGKPQAGAKHTITTLIAVPVALHEVSSGDYKFHTLAELLDSSHAGFQLPQNHRNCLYSLDQWLNERHAIPFVNMDLLFLCNKEGEGIGGLVKAIIENPLHSAKVSPPEDNLVISLNNPIFPSANGGLPETNTTLASNA